MDVRAFAKDFLAAKNDKSSPRIRESIGIRAKHRVICETKQQAKWWDTFTEALAKGHLKPHEFSFAKLFDALVPDGREMRETWDPTDPNGGVSVAPFTEAAGAIQTSDFSNITGQIVYTRMMEELTPEAFPFQTLIPTQSTPYDGEMLPGIAGLGDQAQVVAENDPYPLVGTGEDWIHLPPTVKRGFIVPITKEALFFDRTGMLLRQAGAVGQAMMLNREKRAIDCIIDENTTAHRYKWRDTVYATYQTTTPWDNTTASNALVDWTDIDAADQTLNGITDPNTGEPVVVEADTLICTKSLEQTASRIRNATEVTVITPGYATTGDPSATKISNPVGGKFEIVTSRLLAARLATDTSWFYGNPRRAFVYSENWPMTVVQAPVGSSEEFHRDIVQQFKGSERGAYGTLEPRFMTTSTA